MTATLTDTVQPAPADKIAQVQQNGNASSRPKYAALPGPEYKTEIVWLNAVGFLMLHLSTLYGIYLAMFHASGFTTLWSFLLGLASAEGVLIGAHRLYTHRSFKATLPLRLMVMAWQTVASQNCLWVWVRDHRQHHKYTDTNADPHNASRGFFFAHMGWLLVRKHPDVIEAGRKVDMSDLEADWLVMFQKRYYTVLYILLAILFPTLVPMYLWGETWWNSFFISYLGRLVVVLNITWLVNSWAHLYGTTPFDSQILPKETSKPMAFMLMGEGWHNFHHTFPWDYRASEFGQVWNITGAVIDVLASMGWAYDLKSAPEDMVWRRALRTGDGTHAKYNKDSVPSHLTEELDPKHSARIRDGYEDLQQRGY